MSDNPGAVSAPSEAILQYGGQAVIEGVMMRSPRYFAVACRKPNGSIIVQREDLDKSFIAKLKWLNFPFGRGTLALIDAMALGMKALAFASNVQMQETNTTVLAPDENKAGEVDAIHRAAATGASPTPGAAPGQMPASGKINDVVIGTTFVVSLAFGIGLFVLLPTLLTGLLSRFSPALHGHSEAMRLNIADGIIRMIIFFAYILLISRLENIRRVFEYHGAEHKAINTLEAGRELTCDSALKASRIHPRCGTSFIFVVLLINLLVFAVLPRPPFLLARFGLHLAVIPVVAGIAYETIKAAGKYRKNPVVMAAFAPGMATQYLTTREPDESQVEVALAALLSVLEAEGHIVPEADLTLDKPAKEEPPAAMA